MATDTNEFLTDLDGAVFEKKLSIILSEVAAAVIEHQKNGKVSLDFDISTQGSASQVLVKHKLSYSHPTLHGKKSEEDTTSTPMYTNNDGDMSLFPENQNQMFTRTGSVNEKA